MSESGALHVTSLLLVGRDIHLSPRLVTNDEIPEDERKMDCNFAITAQRKNLNTSSDNIDREMTTIFPTTTMTTSNHRIQKQQEGQLIVANLSGPDESRWRAHGMARRRQILDDDKRKGGRDFSLSFDCSVQRYFSVAHWYVCSRYTTLFDLEVT